MQENIPEYFQIHEIRKLFLSWEISDIRYSNQLDELDAVYNKHIVYNINGDYVRNS